MSAYFDTGQNSFWEKYKFKFFIFGNVYASLHGLLMINYITSNVNKKHRHKNFLLVIYSYVLSFLIIIGLPLYFLWHIQNLLATKERRGQLQLMVNLANTLAKYCMVVMTFIANFIYAEDIRLITAENQALENHIRTNFGILEKTRKKFEFMMYFKFSLINIMMLVLTLLVVYEYLLSSHLIKIYFQFYTFFLWNYTENMANYFYYANCSALKFFRQLHHQLTEIVSDNHKYLIFRQQRGPNSGLLSHLCCVLSDRLDFLAQCYRTVYWFYRKSLRIHQFQIFALILTTSISNLTNLYTLYKLLLNSPPTNYKLTDIILSSIFAVIHFIDAYIVVLTSDQIRVEMNNIRCVLMEFSQMPKIDWRLEETIESFSFSLLALTGHFRICGLFYLDRHLTFLTLATGFTYFITLVQFDINWNNLK